MGFGRRPRYLRLHEFIKAYGTEAVLGRTLYASELYRMTASANIYNAYTSRQAAEDWTKWTRDNPQAAELLARIEKLEHDESD